ncbi:MAG TPA: GAF domain-containing protein, partial [Thermoanaerobaculia bacterium]|nr:GAF domain-containing protein [Thermoanaerobaculia bacterium]
VEIALNLIGAEEFIIYLADDAKADYVVAAREGDRPPSISRTSSLGYAIERSAVENHRTVFASEDPSKFNEPDGPICCAPLFFKDRLIGILTIYALLSHKQSFSQLDRELFDLLGEQAALAIVSSQSFVSVDRKLKTVQRFMDLLKS